MDAKNFVREASRKELIEKITTLAVADTKSALDDLHELLVTPSDHTLDKHEIPHIICRALVQKGPVGIQVILSAILDDDTSFIYRTETIEALWCVAIGKLSPQKLPLPDYWELCPPLDNPPSPESIKSAREALFDLVAESQINEWLFKDLMHFANMFLMTEFAAHGPKAAASFRSLLFDVFTETSIKITHRLINQFQEIIEKEHREEIYQCFLVENPVFIDPLASEVISKQKLGSEYSTDIVIRRLDNEYIVVEIEKPQDRIFTKSNDFYHRFTHAFGQVIDFQEWIEQHAEYARHLMTEISAPKGILIMGRRLSFTSRQSDKLKRFCINSRSVEVFTYDDLLERARNLYQNIHSRIADRFG